MCMFHLNEHHHALNSQLHPLIDEANALSERLTSINLTKKVTSCRQQLEQWRLSHHQKIDQLFEEKSRELDELIAKKMTKQQEKITEVREKLTRLTAEQGITSQDINLLTSNIRYLEGTMHSIEKTSFHVTIQPLTIDNQLITFQEREEQQVDLSIGYPLQKTIPYTPGSWFPLASNEQYLLFHQAPNLCFVDQEFNIIKEILWSHATILHMCWSSTLNGFLIQTEQMIYLVNDQNVEIEDLLANPQQNWLACTCSDSSLFVSTNTWGSSIAQYRLSTTMNLTKQWQPPYSCTTDECIEGLTFSNGTLALVIRNRLKQSIRIELKFAEASDCIWLLRLSTAHDFDQLFRCSSLTYGEWLVINAQARQFLHITKSGQLKSRMTYQFTPYRACLFREDFFVIATDAGLKIHQLKNNTFDNHTV